MLLGIFLYRDIMKPYKEEELKHNDPFPFDVFIKDNDLCNATAYPHWHDCIEILYILEGSVEQQINDKFFHASKDDLIILNNGDIHGTFCKEGERVRILVLKFLSELVDSHNVSLLESKYIMPFLNHHSSTKYRLVDTSRNSTDIYKIMMGLVDEFGRKDTGYEIYIKGYIYQLIAGLIRNGAIALPARNVDIGDFKKFEALFEYIEKNFKQKIDLKQAAGMLNFSYSYFSRYFKKVTGRTFKEYVDFVRICEAEKLIASGGMNISQVALDVGFSNVSSFTRLFKRVKGYPPKSVRRK